MCRGVSGARNPAVHSSKGSMPPSHMPSHVMIPRCNSICLMWLHKLVVIASTAMYHLSPLLYDRTSCSSNIPTLVTCEVICMSCWDVMQHLCMTIWWRSASYPYAAVKASSRSYYRMLYNEI